MRCLLPVCLLACVTPAPPAADPPGDTVAAPQTRALTDFTQDLPVRVSPRVELIPSNALTFHVLAPAPVSVGGHVFAIYRVTGGQAVEVPEALAQWTWNEARRIARVEPTGLQKGAPYLLVGEGITTDDGTSLPTFAHPFRVIGPDTTAPDLSGLQVVGNPQPGTLATLTLPMPEPIQDGAVFQVAALSGATPHPGAWAVAPDHLSLVFTPSEPWTEALVGVTLNAGIRDLAGNDVQNRPQGVLIPQVLRTKSTAVP